MALDNFSVQHLTPWKTESLDARGAVAGKYLLYSSFAFKNECFA